jgi:hypothetical protein
MRKIIFLFTLFVCTQLTAQYVQNTSIEISIGLGSTSQNITSNKEFNILFIGNSLTASNDLPKLVEIAGKQKSIIIKTKMIAYPNYAIMDHWNDGKVQKEIKRNQYDFVIVQQGPSSQQNGREILIEYGRKYADLCNKNGAKLSYFMVWPSRIYYHTFKGVIKNYTDAARINDAILCPVGEEWKKHFDTTQNFDYYSADGFHPSLKGSQRAAEIIVEHLFGDE